ncbi:MAG: hypothetical protein ABSF83_15265 [Nitrososphaerales archaeon]|jgi:ElaB/YqjD/DUF883 family membrane-anchored ribosome-binding protein
MATKGQDAESWDDALQQLREDLDDKLEVIQRKLSKSADRERKIIAEEGEGVRVRLSGVGNRAMAGVGRADDLVRDHPVILVGGVLALGMLLGALLTHRSED